MKEIDYVKIFKALSDEMRLKILQEITKWIFYVIALYIHNLNLYTL